MLDVLREKDLDAWFFIGDTITYVQWDDHKVLNDFSGTVPAFATQMATGNLAFRLYNPIRENSLDPMQLYRSVRCGSGAAFFMLDDRQYRSPEIVCCNSPDRRPRAFRRQPRLFVFRDFSPVDRVRPQSLQCGRGHGRSFCVTADGSFRLS